MLTKQFFNPLLPNRLQQLSLASSAIDTTNTMFVSKGGDDAAALAAGGYDLDDPWLNPTVAMASAVVGDTVIVLPGTYTIGAGGDVIDDGLQQMIKNGVTLYMLPGARIEYTNLTGTASLPFSDGGLASTFIIRGKGEFKFNRNISGNDSWLVTSNAGSVVDWEFDYIDIRRRFGNSANNFSSWRMKGRKLQNRESMLFAFRFPNGNGDTKFIDIDIENVEINSESGNNTWTRQEVRFLNGNSVANFKYGNVTYPNGYPGGGFHQNTSTGNNAKINIDIKAITRANGRTDISDYIIRNSTCRSGGIYNITGIDTQTGITLETGVSGLVTTKRYAFFEGKVSPGHNPLSAAVGSVIVADTLVKYTVDMDLDFATVDSNYVGIYTRASSNTTYKGVIKWINPINPPIRVDASNQARFQDFTITDIPVGVPSIFNIAAGLATLEVINCYATTALSLANGGINQIIETFTIDGNI